MKEKFLSGLKKVAVILIASIMILGVVPIGMLTLKPHTVRAEGEFLRLFPVEEVSVASSAEPKRLSVQDRMVGQHQVSAQSELYLQFDLKTLLEHKELAEVREATLRLTVLRSGTEGALPMRLWLMPRTDWDSSMRYQDRPSALGELKLAELTPSADRQEAEVLEVDLTAYLQKWVEDDLARVALHLDTASAGLAAVLAGSAYEDPICRPCLKVVTGDADDPDTDDLTKARLSRTALTGDPGGALVLRADEKRDAYLKFVLNPENIRGAIYAAHLQLTMLQMDTDAEISIYRLANGGWGETEPLPQGEEYLIYQARTSHAKNLRNIDLSDAVNDVYARGGTELILRISGAGDGIAFSNEGADAPYLELKVSDDEAVEACVEAGIYALEDNPSADAIAENLSESYTAETGVRAEMSWSAKDADTGEDAGSILDESGRITRPAWFEDSRELLAEAKISAGDYERIRRYRLTVLPQDAPELSGKNPDGYLRLGNTAEEAEHALAEQSAEAHSRWIGGKSFSYRLLGADGTMAMYMGVDAEQQNYLTLKVWKGDRPDTTLQVEALSARDAEPVVITVPEEIPAEDGFLYLTYPLPQEATQGQSVAALRLRVKAAQEAEDGWDIYAAYVTQSAYFDPLTFAEQGETFAGKRTGVSAFQRLLNRIYMAAHEPWRDFAELWAREDAAQQTATNEDAESGTRQTAASGDAESGTRQTAASEDAESRAQQPTAETAEDSEALDTAGKQHVWMETDPPMLIFENAGDQIIISMQTDMPTAKMHRSTPTYDTYAETVYRDYGDGLTAIDYGKYHLFRNSAETACAIPWDAEGLAGVYWNLADETYYAFLQTGQMADDSVIPKDATLELGRTRQIAGGETLVLEALAPPLYGAEWRISAVNRRSVSQLSLNRRLSISEVTVRNAGRDTEQEEELQVICCAYENGRLSGISRQTFTVIPGYGEYRVSIPTVTVKPGQTLKIFVETADRAPGAMTPKLELP